MKTFALAVLTALTLGCGSAGSAGSGTASGLKGLVKRGPITPVCRIGVSCDAPAPGVKLVFTRSGKVVATATTNQKGWYRVTLRPGRYAVRTNRRGFERTTSPSAATVPRDRFARRDFHIDTGIR
jgi:Carboxypeptidase regulatory-like domain